MTHAGQSSSADAAFVEIAGEELVLLAGRGLFWKRTSTLLIADPHWGKSAAFRTAGAPIPAGDLPNDLDRLEQLLDRCAAERLIVLGDLLHARSGRTRQVHQIVGKRLARLGRARLLVRGNHDQRAGDPPVSWGFQCVDEPFLEPPFVLRHVPGDDPRGYVLAGHVHPAVRLRGKGRQSVKTPCFLFGRSGAILPAFGEFTGSAVVEPAPDDRVFVLADHKILEA